MIPIVRSIEEAQNHFLSHSEGKCNCIAANGNEQVVDCFPDAEKFFNDNQE